MKPTQGTLGINIFGVPVKYAVQKASPVNATTGHVGTWWSNNLCVSQHHLHYQSLRVGLCNSLVFSPQFTVCNNGKKTELRLCHWNKAESAGFHQKEQPLLHIYLMFIIHEDAINRKKEDHHIWAAKFPMSIRWQYRSRLINHP